MFNKDSKICDKYQKYKEEQKNEKDDKELKKESIYGLEKIKLKINKNYEKWYNENYSK
jgi:hypothetical protein